MKFFDTQNMLSNEFWLIRWILLNVETMLNLLSNIRFFGIISTFRRIHPFLAHIYYNFSKICNGLIPHIPKPKTRNGFSLSSTSFNTNFDSLWNILIHYWWLMFCSAVGQFYQLMKKRFPAIF